MARPKRIIEGEVQIRILADGVFIAEDDRRDAGDVATVPQAIANVLIERRHAKPV